jgi:putative SOS response-associated peptidase YedK
MIPERVTTMCHADGRSRPPAPAATLVGDHNRRFLLYHAPMCGRFTLTVSARVLADLFGVEDVPDLRPRYNIAPTQPVLVVRGGGDTPREFGEVRWGLIPSWAKDASIGARMINARAETVADKPAFRSAVRRRRCLIPSDGFYEWRKLAGGKQPYLIRFADGSPFGFAGLWERWHDSDGRPVDSCTIITTTPNDLVAELHDRMPVVLPQRHYAEWLGPDTLATERLNELLQAHPSSGMEAHPVSKRVNSPQNDDPDCVRRIDAPGLS